jgi:hypothetical protein
MYHAILIALITLVVCILPTVLCENSTRQPLSVPLPDDCFDLMNISTLTFVKGALTTHRRSSPRPQLHCIDPLSVCLTYERLIDAVQCYNKGMDDRHSIQWACTCADMPIEVAFISTNVVCEGYDHPDAVYQLVGSCGLEYTLKITSSPPPDDGFEVDPDSEFRGVFWMWFGVGMIALIVLIICCTMCYEPPCCEPYYYVPRQYPAQPPYQAYQAYQAQPYPVYQSHNNEFTTGYMYGSILANNNNNNGSSNHHNHHNHHNDSSSSKHSTHSSTGYGNTTSL